jgi:V/A-type H+/Na+-transporting ATPase subunit D
MAKVAMNKGALQKQRDQLRLYQRLLPSLDLKRRQLTAEANRARAALAQAQAEVERVSARVADQLPMLANAEISVSGLVQIDAVQVEEENLVGVKVPVLKELRCTVRDYSLLAKPHWVDVLVQHLQAMAELRLQVQVAAERVRCLDRAVRRTTQRVNLFDKILIPNAKKDIQRIQIFLGDAERAAIVRSKLAKAKAQRLLHEHTGSEGTS